jgi:guanine deaminase
MASATAAPPAAAPHLLLPGGAPQLQALLLRVVRHAEASVALGGGPFAAAVVRRADGALVALEANCVVSSGDPTAHAEVAAIRAAARSLGGRVDLSGLVLLSSCEPCPMCAGAALWARLDAVLFAASAADAAAGGFDDAAFHAEARLAPGDAARRQPLMKVELAGDGGGGGSGSGSGSGSEPAGDEALRPFRAWAAKDDRARY